MSIVAKTIDFSSPHSFTRLNEDICVIEDLRKPMGPILTGIGYLDHMIDQFNSHAQVGVSLIVANFATVSDVCRNACEIDQINRHSNDQAKVMRLTGSKLGIELRHLLVSSKECGFTSNFSCPLDEALVSCMLERDVAISHYVGSLRSYDLPPYGKYARKYIGQLETKHLELFWSSLAESSGLDISFTKNRGKNSHHIVESSFKSFARALRNLLDGIDTLSSTEDDARKLSNVYGIISSNWTSSLALRREASIERRTKETRITACLRLDGGANGIRISTGIHTLDDFFDTFGNSANLSLQLECMGDLWIDEHHTAEDASIAVGQVINEALGSKAGLNRMWSCRKTRGDAQVEVIMDLSNRPLLAHNLFRFARVETVGDLSLEMFEHVLESLTVNARMTLHIVEVRASNDPVDIIQCVAQALGSAFFYCSSIDKRRSGMTASSKGTLSV